MTWFHFALTYVFFNASAKIIQKYSLKNEDINPSAFSGLFFLAVGILTIPFLVFEKIVYSLDPKIWLLVLLSGFLYTICMRIFFMALQNTEVSQVETLATTRTIWLMLLGIIFFKEKIYLSQYIGVFLIFLGLVVIYWQRGEVFSFQKNHFYILAYSFLVSCAYALDKYLLTHFSVILFQVIIYLVPAFLSYRFMPFTSQDIKSLLIPKKENYIILSSFFLQMISTLALYAAYQIGELSLVGPVAQISTIVIIIVGLIVFKERWNLCRKIIGITLTILGIILIRFVTF